MKSLILAVLASLSIAFAGYAGAGVLDNNAYPEGSIQTSAE
jgi:hypothetical protein